MFPEGAFLVFKPSGENFNNGLISQGTALNSHAIFQKTSFLEHL
jgi:hypothetical protein